MPSIKRRSKERPLQPPVAPRADVSVDLILDSLATHGRDFDADLVRAAYDLAAERHAGQERASGGPYVEHLVYTGWLLADQRFDAATVIAGLLHDVIEDTDTDFEEVAEGFGTEVAELVDGVTKIGRHAYVRRDQAQAETFRKLILASVRDVRAIVIKLADRLHNMLTLGHLPVDKQRRIARETLEIYAPIAHRLGMARVQGDLEDLAFFHLFPHQYGRLHESLEERIKEARSANRKIRQDLARTLEEAGIEAEISHRLKRSYSIYTKLRRRGISLDRLYDYLAYRVITDDVKSCYAALGVVHQRWRPVPGRFKDYVAMPKPNLYQSLHTTLVSDQGAPFEVQIRTLEMERVAEEGIAAHWRYKAGDSSDEEGQAIGWLRQLLEWQQGMKDPQSFLASLKIDLFPDEVYVFTPKGDVMSFPRGATPLDFAYRVHTDVGHSCSGARVNGKLVPLRTELANGDQVEVLTDSNRTPSRDWLDIVVTTRARTKIRQWLNARQKERATDLGRKMLEKELRKHSTTLKKFLVHPDLDDYLSDNGVSKPDDLLSEIGFGKVAARTAVEKVLRPGEDEKSDQAGLSKGLRRWLPGGSRPVVVEGHGDLLVYLAKCCNPLPGDAIVGYVTRGRGVSVHRTDCPNIEKLLYHPEREVEVAWGKGDDTYAVVVDIETVDEPGILASLTETIAAGRRNIRQISADTRQAGRGNIAVVVEVSDRDDLDKLCDGLLSLPGVLGVERRMTMPGE